MSFPILQLPNLARRHIFELLSLRDLFVLSVLSQKTRRAMKQSIPKNSIKLNFRMLDGRGVQIVENESKNSIEVSELIKENKLTHVTIGTERMKAMFWRTTIVCSWKNLHLVESREKAFATFLNFFLDAFNRPSVSLEFSKETRQNFVLETLKYVNKLKLKLIRVTYNSENCPPNIFENIIKECVHASEIDFNVKFPARYVYTPPSPDTFKLDKFKTSTTNWWRFEDFMQCKIIYLSFPPKNWSPQKLNSFLRMLIESESRLELVDFPYYETTSLTPIVRELSDNTIQVTESKQSLEIRTKFGKRMMISLSTHPNAFVIKEIRD